MEYVVVVSEEVARDRFRTK